MVDQHEVFLVSRAAAMRSEPLILTQREWDEVQAALPDDDEGARGERSIYGTPVVIGEGSAVMDQALAVEGRSFPQMDNMDYL